MKKVAVLIKDVDQQYEGLRISLGALLDDVCIQMYVLDHEIAQMDDAYRENMEFLDEMEGERFSNHMGNAENFGFKSLNLEEIAERIRAADLIIPF